MGTCYCLQKIDRGEEYDLSKGSWPFPLDRPFYMASEFPYIADLAERLADDNKWAEIDFWITLAAHIWEWARDDRLMCYSDYGDEVDDEDVKDLNEAIADRKFRGPYYKETGNRFQPFTADGDKFRDNKNSMREQSFRRRALSPHY